MKRNALSKAIKFAIGGALAGMLAACGGGGSSSGSSDSADTSSGSSVGPVSGFGSVYVNGTRFHTDGAVNSDDGVERETQLEKGMILKVRGSWDDSGEGEAQSVDYDDTIRGPLTSATWDDVAKTGTLSVAGQTIHLDGQTVFKGLGPVELNGVSADTYRVRVSGWQLNDGSFRASFVGVKAFSVDFDDDNEVEIEGVVENLDTDAQTFTINGFPVDYTSAVFDDDMIRDDLRDGLAIEVEGSLEGGVLIARKIDDEDDLFDDDDDVEIVGAVYDFDAANRTFFVNGVQVQIDGSTEFDDGLSEGSVVNGLLVKVEGEYRNGVLIADEIEPRDGDAELEGVIESKPDSETLIVSGVRVVITSGTLIEDDDDDDRITMRTQDIESLNVGDFLEIEGRQRPDDGGFLEAITVEREDDSDDSYEMDGRVTGLSSTTITVLGLEMLRGSADFTGIEVGSEVEVDYFRNSGGDYVVNEIEEDD
ncbi:hypothetical protein MARLIPOL_03380 [Marinobacter lipolyticus SM19]|uniref:DUF5666 domain-containing protein n=1 Tax=Marinobacter lipolyticus SM19 TaxID=1318628 RepID=R8B375_9GAMM|nr:DUF5666 domain-containing protein [Marinobacter lipolyticus]EON93042.1 hypothetical protein MARLIPOL_03380 [Marinobacter lipolyticus SM19]